MKVLHLETGPIATNVWILGDETSGEAIAIDTATPSVRWLTEQLATRGWTLKLVVSSHRHWDHIGDNAAVIEKTGADLAVHIADRHGLEHPEPMSAPFEIPPSVPALDLAEGSRIRFGEMDFAVLHTPGHTEGSVCLVEHSERILVSGDTLFAGGWGRVDLPGGSAEEMVESLTRLSTLEEGLTVLPGHGPRTRLGKEKPWLSMVAQQGRLLF